MTRDNTASPGNPLMRVLTETMTEDGQNVIIGTSYWIWCPGCEQVHRPRVRHPNGIDDNRAYWDFDGNMESPTFSPSLLVYNSVHLCGPDVQHYEICEDPACSVYGHYVPEEGVRAHTLACPKGDWGNCHSFIRNGTWQFLEDSGHKLAGQTVPMVPLPDWLCR